MAEAVKNDWRQIIILNEFCQCPIANLPLYGSAAGRSKYKVGTLQLLIHKDVSTIILDTPFGNINAVPSQTEHLAHTQGTGKSKNR